MAFNEDAEKRQAKADAQVNLEKRKEYGEAYAAALGRPTASSTFKEPSGSLLDNPPFIFPGPLTTIAVTGQKYKPKRGYIRRLNEFYEKMGPEAKSITGRRCNFQFQPETIVRSVSAQSTDTQFFFNQDPAQLSVPIPGQSNYNITLMFNREAEVASGKYTNNFGKLMQSKNLRDVGSELNVNQFITGDYQQEWVCSIGVLADIMVLDGVIGQGISTETIKILNTISSTQAAATATDSTATEEQKKQAQDILEKESQKVKYWTQDAATNPNLGNTAFLVPTPVRIMLSNMMMIEGFILTSSVNFHKFSKHYIPTQCRVDLTVQALYIGFAKNQTLLTQDTPLSLTSGGSGPDEVTVKEKDANILKNTQEGIDSFFKTCKFNENLVPKNAIFLTGTQGFDTGYFQSNFLMSINNPVGEEFYKIYTSANGGEVTWFWEATIKMFWWSMAVDQQDNRVTGVVSAPVGTTFDLVKKEDFYPGGQLFNLKEWGTEESPLIITASGIGVKDVNNFGRQDRWWLQGAEGDPNGNKAKWTFSPPTSPTYKRPFNEEQFRFKLEVTISAKRYGADYVSKQKFKFDQVPSAINASTLSSTMIATI
jgi:hypothetical protein